MSPPAELAERRPFSLQPEPGEDGAPVEDFALVELRGLAKDYPLPRPGWFGPRPQLRAVDGLDLRIPLGRTYGLVGESGCGKSTVARMVVGLTPPSAGEVRFDGHALHDSLRGRAARSVRRRLQMVFQDPHASLNPRWTVGRIIEEPMLVHGDERGRRLGRRQREARVVELLRRVGLTPDDAARWPHQFSGGQRQRIAIARALAASPDFLVCDEPTSALDMSVQAQVLALLAELKRDYRGLTMLFISHSLAVVRQVSDLVGVMYLGRLVEEGPADRIFAMARHPYTRQLVAAVPDPARRGQPRPVVLGERPDPSQPPLGCAFHPRCPLANERCRTERPRLRRIEAGDGLVGRVACHAVQEGRA